MLVLSVVESVVGGWWGEPKAGVWKEGGGFDPSPRWFGYAPASERSSSPALGSPYPFLTLRTFAWVFRPTGPGSPFLVGRGGLKLFAVGIKDQKKTENKHPTAATMLHKRGLCSRIAG